MMSVALASFTSKNRKSAVSLPFLSRCIDPTRRRPPAVWFSGRPSERTLMPLQFHRAVEDMEIWSASSDHYSFVISFQSPTGPGFRGRLGYVASWRPLHQGRGAIRVLGLPLQSFAEAEDACNTMLNYLKDDTDSTSQQS